MIEGQSYTQKSGLAMGNNLAPTLAIIYTNKLDQKIRSRLSNELQLKRYIDDIFISWSSDNITPDTILNTANSLNPVIKFTTENPEGDRLPFLDTMITLHHNTGSFSSKLYTKPIQSQCITPWESHGPISQKKGIFIGEIKRAISRSTDAASRKDSLNKITDTYIKNGYQRRFIQSTITSTLRKKKTPEQKEDIEKDLIYIKMPFINEDLKRQTQAVIKRTGISNIRVYYVNGRTSAIVFKAPKDKQRCPDNCDTCSAAKVAKRCLVKNCVYKIDCRHFHLIYIGESSRTIGSRLKEHIRMQKQTVYVHLATHKKSPSLSDISWEVLHNHIQAFNTRKIVEALEIRKHEHNIMNGCMGRLLSID